MNGGEFLDAVLHNREDAARATRAVVDAVTLVAQGIGHGEDGEVGQEVDVIARGVVFTRLGYAEIFIELTEQFFEEGTHRVVVECGELLAGDFFARLFVSDGLQDGRVAEVDVFIGHLLNHITETADRGELLDKMAQVELRDDVLHMEAEAVEVGLEVLALACAVALSAECLHGKGGGVVEGEAREHAELLFLTYLGHELEFLRLAELHHRLFGRLKQEVETA